MPKKLIKIAIKQKRNLVVQKIVPNNSKSLWDAVKLAKILNVEPNPTKMSVNDI